MESAKFKNYETEYQPNEPDYRLASLFDRMMEARYLHDRQVEAEGKDITVNDVLELYWNFLNHERKYFEQFKGYKFDYMSDNGGTRSETVIKNAEFLELRFNTGINHDQQPVVDIGIDCLLKNGTEVQPSTIIWEEGDLLSFGNIANGPSLGARAHRSN